MPYLLQYLIKFSISLAVLYVFYRAVLRPLTFYQWNRFYLAGYALLSFIIPFININVWITGEAAQNPLINIIPVITAYAPGVITAAVPPHVSLLQRLTLVDWLVILFCVGALVMFTRLVIQYLSLRRIRAGAVLLESQPDVLLYETNAAISPFSFGKSIYFNRSMHDSAGLERIIRHEFVHVKQKHTIDLMIGELLCIVNWYNPFAWFIRYSIRQNLEFIADNNVLENGFDKKEYQYLLLKVMGVAKYSIANNFNFSNLKKRIAMMNKMKSARVHLTKFFFVLPLLLIILVAFRNSQSAPSAGAPGSLSDSLPNRKFSAAQMQKELKEISSLLRNNPSVQLFYTTEDKEKQIAFLKNGTIEMYGYDGKPSVADMEKKYGPLPAVLKQRDNDASEYLAHWEVIAAAAGKIFRTDNGNAKTVMFPGDSRVLVQLQNNKVEVYDMDYVAERKLFEQRYGKLPSMVPASSRNDNDTIPPPPPPPVKVDEEVREVRVADDVVEVRITPRGNVPYNKKGYKITILDNSGECIVIVKDKSNKIVKALPLTEWNESKEQNEAQYGEILVPPPPPPARAKIIRPAAGEKEIRISEKQAVVELETGKEVIYNLEKPVEKAAFEKKYGKLVPFPPVPAGKPSPVISILRFNNDATLEDPRPATEPKPGVKVRGISVMDDNILFVVDGLVCGKETLNDIAPNDIESINVLKDKAAVNAFGEKAKAGVIIITTKKVKKVSPITIKSDSISFKNMPVMIHGEMKVEEKVGIVTGNISIVKANAAITPVFYNGKNVSNVPSFKTGEGKYTLASLDAKDAMARYGADGRNGVVEITSL